MFRLFWKSLVNVFLWIILLANLLMFFGIQSPLTMVGNDMTQFQDKYFGVSSVIELIKYLPNTPLSTVTDTLQNVFTKLFSWSAKAFNWGLSYMFESFDGTFDGSDILFILFNGFYLLIQIGSSLVSFTIGVAGILVLVAWIIFFLISLVQFLILFADGLFANSVPTYPSMDIEPYILSVNNVLTSLRACC